MSSRSTRATSAVSPEGPGAAPLRARRRPERTSSGRSWAGGGWKSKASGGRGPYGWRGPSAPEESERCRGGPGDAHVGWSDPLWLQACPDWGHAKVAGLAVPHGGVRASGPFFVFLFFPLRTFFRQAAVKHGETRDRSLRARRPRGVGQDIALQRRAGVRVAKARSERSLRCDVHPDGPAAAPLRPLRTLRRNLCELRAKGSRGWLERKSGGSGTWRVGGRRSGSRRAAKVSSDAGAIGIAVRAALAAESSPKWASAAALSARRCASSSAALARDGPGTSLPAAASAAASSRSRHCPAASSSTRLSSSARGTRVSPRPRYSNMRGARRKSFQPSAELGSRCTLVRPAVSAAFRALRIGPGGDCSV